MASSSSSADLPPTTGRAPQASLPINASPSPAIVRDDAFYFSIVVFQVENTLFKIPSHVLNDHSDVFQTMFSLPPGENITEGLSDDNPIVLKGVTSYDFKQLLKVLYDRTVLPTWTSTISNQGGSQLPITLEEWTPVLRLSDKWEMTTVHQFAIDKMTVMSMNPVDRLALALEFDIKAWKMPALNALAQRQEPMTRRDVEKLGLDVVLQIAEVRESLTQSPAGGEIIVGRRQAGKMDFSSRISEVFSTHFKPLNLGAPSPRSPSRTRRIVALSQSSPQQTPSIGHYPVQTQPRTQTTVPSSPFTFNLASNASTADTTRSLN